MGLCHAAAGPGQGGSCGTAGRHGRSRQTRTGDQRGAERARPSPVAAAPQSRAGPGAAGECWAASRAPALPSASQFCWAVLGQLRGLPLGIPAHPSAAGPCWDGSMGSRSPSQHIPVLLSCAGAAPWALLRDGLPRPPRVAAVRGSPQCEATATPRNQGCWRGSPLPWVLGWGSGALPEQGVRPGRWANARNIS